VTLLPIIENIGLMAFAMSGIIEARRKRFDLVGVYAVALCTAFGGGTLRDLLLDRKPILWVNDPVYALAIFGLAVGAIFLPAFARLRERYLQLPDAIGLGLFSITGTGYALESGVSLFVSILMGVITGTFGGVLRDIICNELPSIFRRTELYATCSFLGSLVYALLLKADLNSGIAAGSGVAVVIVARLIAIRYSIKLPDRAGE
jgi:uncharacterized membrane protein YeiH